MSQEHCLMHNYIYLITSAAAAKLSAQSRNRTMIRSFVILAPSAIVANPALIAERAYADPPIEVPQIQRK